jgi:hypothetical protein
MKASFLNGDYLQQFYPWSKIYSEAIKNFSFPFWTRYVNSGFPLMAEGQIGGFYPLNIILFSLLPFNVAYNYSIIIHFILGGIFTYIYSRKMGADQWGGALAALIFCFGSGYAGCFYNIITLRTLVWFPLGLLIIEKYFDAKKIKYYIYLGIILSMQFLAGFTQMAVYSALFYVIYFIYGLKIRQNLKIDDIVRIAISFLVAFILFLPQFILTLKMADLSTRGSTSLGFALWGSFNPINLISLCFPKVIFHGSQFYIGIFSIVFFIFAMFIYKKELKIKPIFIILLVSFFLSLGAYNPLYVLAIKVINFYSFRNPSKFIFFSVFAAAVLSGYGFTLFSKINYHKEKIKAIRTAFFLIGASIITFILSNIILRLFKENILAIGKWYVTHYVFGKEYHRHYLHTYISKVGIVYDELYQATSFLSIFILISFFLCLMAMFTIRYLMKIKNINNIHKIIITGFIVFDLFIFSFYGIGFSINIKSFQDLKITHNKILNILKSERDIFRILPFAMANENMPWWAKPSSNILVEVDSIASYSPLVQKNYKDEISSLEIVDNSLGIIYPETKAIKDKYNLLRILNVKYVIASEELNFDFLEKVIAEDKIILYKLNNSLPRLFFLSNLDGNALEEQITPVEIIKYGNGYIEGELDSPVKGFVIFSENYYPTWDVYVDGVKTQNIKFMNLIQAAAVDKGKHKIIFKYRPF